MKICLDKYSSSDAEIFLEKYSFKFFNWFFKYIKHNCFLF